MQRDKNWPLWDWVVYRTHLDVFRGLSWKPLWWLMGWLEMAAKEGRGVGRDTSPHEFMYVLSCLRLDIFLPRDEVSDLQLQPRIPNCSVLWEQWSGLAGINLQLNCSTNSSVSLSELKKHSFMNAIHVPDVKSWIVRWCITEDWTVSMPGCHLMCSMFFSLEGLWMGTLDGNFSPGHPAHRPHRHRQSLVVDSAWWNHVEKVQDVLLQRALSLHILIPEWQSCFDSWSWMFYVTVSAARWGVCIKSLS